MSQQCNVAAANPMVKDRIEKVADVLERSRLQISAMAEWLAVQYDERCRESDGSPDAHQKTVDVCEKVDADLQAVLASMRHAVMAAATGYLSHGDDYPDDVYGNLREAPVEYPRVDYSAYPVE